MIAWTVKPCNRPTAFPTAPRQATSKRCAIETNRICASTSSERISRHRPNAPQCSPLASARNDPPEADSNSNRAPNTPASRTAKYESERRLYPFPPHRFHALFNSLFKVLFDFPSQYLSSIGLVAIFSLRWSVPPALSCDPKQLDSKAWPSQPSSLAEQD